MDNFETVFVKCCIEDAESKDNIKGFLLAVSDCCLTDEAKNEVPSFVAEKLTEMAGIGGNQKVRA